MAGGKYMGPMGNLGGPVQKGIVTYSLSPYHQRAFAGFFGKQFRSAVRRVSAQIPYIAPAVLFGYSVYTWGNNKFAYYESKAGAHEVSGH